MPRTVTAYAIAAWLAVLAIFLVMSFFAAEHDRFPGDLWLTRQFQALDFPPLTEPLVWSQRLVEWPYWGVIGVFASVAAVMLVGIRVIPVIAFALPSRELMFWAKEVIERPRPSPELVEVTGTFSGYSFPSGHAFNAIVIFGLLLYLATFYVRGRYTRLALQAVCTWSLISPGLARIYVGVHWPSDVIGGWFMGLLVITALLAFGESLPGGRLASRRRR